MEKVTKILLILIVGAFVAVAGFQLYKNFNQSGVSNVGKSNTTSPENQLEDIEVDTDREIMMTDDVKHSVPLDEIKSGGVAKDVIPSIDNPKFVSIEEAGDWLSDDEPGIALSIGDTNRFYPYQVMVWHEIVNDTIDGQKVLVTYCPLCLTGFVMDPVVNGERVEFGTSGKLWKSNLVMYDRKTDSYWSQVLAEAIAGPMTGETLEVLPSDQMRFGNWKSKFPRGEVLSKDTGASRPYGSNPYGDYFEAVGFAKSMAGPADDRLPADALVFGIVVDGKPKAYYTEAVKRESEVTDEFQEKTFILRYNEELEVVRMYEQIDGELERIAPISGFWFSWSSAYPDTELFK